MGRTKIQNELFKLQDKKYRDFHKKLMPTVDEKTIIGVRTPNSRKLAKEVAKSGEADKFLDKLPHKYFDENQLHAFIVSGIKDYDEALKKQNEVEIEIQPIPNVENQITQEPDSPREPE